MKNLTISQTVQKLLRNASKILFLSFLLLMVGCQNTSKNLYIPGDVTLEKQDDEWVVDFKDSEYIFIGIGEDGGARSTIDHLLHLRCPCSFDPNGAGCSVGPMDINGGGSEVTCVGACNGNQCAQPSAYLRSNHTNEEPVELIKWKVISMADFNNL